MSILLLFFFYVTVPISSFVFFFFFNDTATTEIYTLSLHDALPIFWPSGRWTIEHSGKSARSAPRSAACAARRSEEHTSELQSPCNLVCRLLLEKMCHSGSLRIVSSIIRRNIFFFNDTATTEIYTLSLHDALPITAVSGVRSSSSTSTEARYSGSVGLSSGM